MSFVSLERMKRESWELVYLSMRSWAGFAETVSLFDRHFESFVYCFNELSGQWRGPAAEHAESTEIISVDYRMLSKQQDYWWNHIRKCYLMFLNNGTELLDIEFRHHY